MKIIEFTSQKLNTNIKVLIIILIHFNLVISFDTYFYFSLQIYV